MTWDSISQPAAAAWAPLRMGQAYGVRLMELRATTSIPRWNSSENCRARKPRGFRRGGQQ